LNISKSNFENEGEVDFTAHHKEGNKIGRVSLRRKNNRYEVYVYWFREKKEEILHHSEKLSDCIDFTNARFGLNDKVAD